MTYWHSAYPIPVPVPPPPPPSPNCKYCLKPLAASGAAFCCECDLFQLSWRNWLPHATTIIAVLTLCGTVGGFMWQSFVSFEKESYAREQEALLGSVKTIDEACLQPFARLARDVESIMIAFDKTIRDRVAAVRFAEAVKRPVTVRYAENECLGDSKRCTLVILRERDDPYPQQLVPEPPFPQIIAVATAIRQYSDGLQSIASSATVDQIKTSFGSVSGSMTLLAKLTGDIDRPGMLNDFESDGVTADTGMLRLSALRYAVQMAYPILEDSETVLSDTLEQSSLFVRESLAETALYSLDAYREQPSAASLRDLMSAAGDYNLFISFEPQGLVQMLVRGHTALTQDLSTQQGCQYAASQFAAMQYDLTGIRSALRITAEARVH